MAILIFLGIFLAISPYAIIGYSRLYYHKLFVVILLVAIGAYFINAHIFY